MFKQIAILDDHAIVRKGLEMLLSPIYGKNNIHSFSFGEDLFSSMNRINFDLIILDIKLPKVLAFSFIPQILKLRSNQKVLIFSMYPEKIVAKGLFKLGIKGYINKTTDNAQLILAIKIILEGGNYMTQELQSFFFSRYIREEQGKKGYEALSNRELEVLMLLLRGLGVLEISNFLSINTSTAATYKGRIFEKMEVSTFLDLYHKSQSVGLI